jgi:two-component system phosphate regulon sensor histidine kinase PhoR
MFLDGDLGKLSPEQENLMKKAFDSNERAIKNLTDILDTNKTENRVEKEYIFEKVNICELLEETIFDFSGEAHMKGIEIIFLRPDHVLKPMRADKEKLRVILQNLIENAIKYSDPHGKVFITAKESKNKIQVSIKDTGTGISDEGKARIFEKFYRDTEAEKREITGTGIGLYTVKRIIDKSMGEIWFESNPGEGTIFYFTLPIYE